MSAIARPDVPPGMMYGFDPEYVFVDGRRIFPISGGSEGEVADPPPADGGEGTPPPAAVDPAAFTVLQGKLAAAEAKLTEVDGMKGKLAIVDKMMEVFGGRPVDPQDAEYKTVYDQLKTVARRAAPGFAKALDLLEKDPAAFDRLGGAVQKLESVGVQNLNDQAHTDLVDVARKAGLRGKDDGEMSALIYPYEAAITQIINGNPEIRKQFLAGNRNVVRELFNELHKPHAAMRQREKSAVVKPGEMPRAVPRGGAAAEAGESPARKFDVKTPQGKMDFHKHAVNTFLSKAMGGGE